MYATNITLVDLKLFYKKKNENLILKSFKISNISYALEIVQIFLLV